MLYIKYSSDKWFKGLMYCSFKEILLKISFIDRRTTWGQSTLFNFLADWWGPNFHKKLSQKRTLVPSLGLARKVMQLHRCTQLHIIAKKLAQHIGDDTHGIKQILSNYKYVWSKTQNLLLLNLKIAVMWLSQKPSSNDTLKLSSISMFQHPWAHPIIS